MEALAGVATIMPKLMPYVVGSAVLAGAVAYHAFVSREQFYPAMLYLATSKLSVVVMGNLMLALTLVLGKVRGR